MTRLADGITADAPPIPDTLMATLQSWRRPVILGHVRPDADCLGSMLAVALTWPGTDGKAASISLPPQSVSRRLGFLIEWSNAPVAEPEDFANADGFVAVDTAQKTRCNVVKEFGDGWSEGRDLINIDHHTSNTEFGEINWIDPVAGSTSELIYRLIVASGRPLTPLVASLLYAGIHSDTVGFSLPTTAASALRAAGDLVEHGARVAQIGEHLCRSQDACDFDLLRIIYDNTKLVADGRIAYSTASYEEITGAGCTVADIDDQVTVPRSLRGVRAAVLLTEGVKGKTRINLRGEADVGVLELARKLGGGGHAQAAGAILNATIQEAVDRVIPMVIAQLDAHEAHREQATHEQD